MEYRIDLFSIFIFLGIVQTVFLSFFFFSRENRLIKASVFQGLMLVSMAFCNVEILLMYTGYIQHCWWLVDFSEPIAFMIGPSFYLMVLSLVHGEFPKGQYWHFAFPLIYTLLIIPYFIQPDVVKYNSWVYSYHPELPFKSYDFDYDPRAFWITDQHTALVLISLVLYAILGLYEIVKAFRKKNEPFFTSKHPVLGKLRAGALQWTFATILILGIKTIYKSDTGDHWFAAYISVIIYLTSFRVISHSGFFKQASLNDTGRTRAIKPSPEADAIVQRLHDLMERDKPFLAAGFSLSDLATRLSIPTHTLSQLINDRMGKNFFELIADYRIREAKRLLTAQHNIKIEEIAEQVGYSSKSSFNIAFKKITGKTPSEFRDQRA